MDRAARAPVAAPVPRPAPPAPPPLTLPAEGRGYSWHVGTENLSFLKTSQVLSAAGVKNSRFMLALYDEDLAGVDPHDGALPDEVLARVLAEIVRNPWYFFREVVRIPVPGGTAVFDLHLGNLFLLWAQSNNLNCYLLLPRQNYKTVSACCFYLWAYAFGSLNSHMLFFNKEHGDSKNNLKRVKDIMELLPDWLLLGVLEDAADKNNIEHIESGHRNNRIDAKPCGTNPEQADKLGRGATVPLRWYDEIAFAKYIVETYMAAAPAGSKADELAAANHRPYGTCVTTTPNLIDDPSGGFAYRLMLGSLHFRLDMYDLGPDAVREMIDSEAEFPFLFAEYKWQALGRSEAWYRKQCRDLLGDKTKIKREIDLIWPMSSESSVFDEEALDALLAAQVEVSAVMAVRSASFHRPGLEVQFCEMPDPAKAYLIGLDTASGLGLDSSAWVIVDPEDLRAIGHVSTNTADDEDVKEITRILWMDCFPRSILVAERNHLGLVVLNWAVKQDEPRVFYLNKERKVERTVGAHVLHTTRMVRAYGVNTDSNSRPAMLRNLSNIVENTPELLPLRALGDQIRTLQRKPTGKVEHRAGFHDDLVFAYLVVVYAAWHTQPVLQGLIRRQQGAGVAPSAAVVTALNEGEAAGGGAAAAAQQAGARSLSVDEYVEGANARAAAVEEEDPAVARRRRAMANAIVALNGGIVREEDQGPGGRRGEDED